MVLCCLRHRCRQLPSPHRPGRLLYHRKARAFANSRTGTRVGSRCTHSDRRERQCCVLIHVARSPDCRISGITLQLPCPWSGERMGFALGCTHTSIARPPLSPHFARRHLRHTPPCPSFLPSCRSHLHPRQQHAAEQSSRTPAATAPPAVHHRRLWHCSAVCNSTSSAAQHAHGRRDRLAVLSVLLLGWFVLRFSSAQRPGVVLAALQATAGPIARKGAARACIPSCCSIFTY